MAAACKNSKNRRFKRDVCGHGNTGKPIEIYHGKMTTNDKQKENYKERYTKEIQGTWPKKCGIQGCEGDAAVGADVYSSKELKDSSEAMIIPTSS